jgi:hypothetical protein
MSPDRLRISALCPQWTRSRRQTAYGSALREARVGLENLIESVDE